MSTRITYCLRGCMRNYDGTRYPVQVDPPAVVCDNCTDHLKQILRDIPTKYDLLPLFVNHGTVEKNPDAKHGPAVEAPAPMRLEIIDHLDDRLGRHWQGLVPVADRRGAVGTLHAHAQRVREEKPLAPLTTKPTVDGEAALLNRHLNWLTEQPWVTEAIRELDILNKQLGEAIGERKTRAIATCQVELDDGPCGGPLLPSRFGGVHCPRCQAVWDIDELQRLGRLLGEQSA